MNMRMLIGKSIIILAVIVASLSSGRSYAQEVTPRDYFDPKNKAALATVERYHLSKNTFWADYELKRYHYAFKELEFVLRHFPNHPKALQLAELTARMYGRPHLVIPYYEKAVTLYPQYALTHAQYGNYLVTTGQVEKGIERLQRALQINPKLTITYHWLYQAYTKSGNSEMARTIAEKGKELGLEVEEGPR